MIPSLFAGSGRLLVIAGVLLCAPPMVRSVAAQPVLLQIRPRIGDTISVRMDQQVEMTGVPVGCVSGPAPLNNRAPAGAQSRLCADGTRNMTTRMEVFSRAIVKGSSSKTTTLLALTDSIRTSASATPGENPTPTRISAPGGTLEFRVASDGGTEISNADASDELRAIFDQMPAMLSRKPVSVGDKWTREMRIPQAAETGANGRVRATFQFDSLGRNGDIAYISMRGTLSHDRGDRDASEMSGSLTGVMHLDRRLAWITETRARIDARSIVRPAAGPPMTVTTRITQHLRAAKVR